MCRINAINDARQMRVHMIRGRKERSRMFRSGTLLIARFIDSLIHPKLSKGNLELPRRFNPTRV